MATIVCLGAGRGGGAARLRDREFMLRGFDPPLGSMYPYSLVQTMTMALKRLYRNPFQVNV